MIEQVIQVVRSVAQIEVMPRYLRVSQQRKSDGSLYTAADIASQDALTQGLREILPYPVVGEEMNAHDQENYWRQGAEGLWCLDPIDGTSNFVNGLPYFAVSVALLRQGRPVLGVVYNPVADELFFAQKGKGSYLNLVKLPIKARMPEMKNAMAAVDFKRIGAKLARELADNPPYSSQRNFGASTLEWCYVAAGRFDVYLHGSQKLWDYAAGALILEEAGGRMCTLEHDDFWTDDVWRRSVIAALDPELFAQWKAWIKARL